MRKLLFLPLISLISCSNEQRSSNGISFFQSEKVVQKKCELVKNLHGTNIVYCDIFDDCITVKDKDDKLFVLHMNSDLVTAIHLSTPEITKLPKLDCSQVSFID